FETKRKYYTERIKKDPSDIDAYIEFANIEDREGMFMSARRHLLAARALGAPDTRVSPILGRTLSRLAREEEARLELEKAAKLSPDSVDSVLNLAGFHVDSRRIGAARDVLSKWIAAHPDYTDKTGLERLVMALVSCADEKAASQLSEKLLQLAPDDPGALTLAARTAMDNADASKARGYLEKLLPIAPDQAGANYLYGLILYRLKDYDGALKAWLKANELNPAAPDVYERIGQEYARRGDFKKAAFALDQIATVDQGYPAAYRAARACEKAGYKDDANYWDATALGLRGAFAEALAMAKKAAATTNPKRKRRALIAVAEAYRGLKKTKEYVATIEEATKENTVDDL
ncbi:MAG: tetratricopeptide repeat protein, partial [Armatimonadota bacterium]